MAKMLFADEAGRHGSRPIDTMKDDDTIAIRALNEETIEVLDEPISPVLTDPNTQPTTGNEAMATAMPRTRPSASRPPAAHLGAIPKVWVSAPQDDRRPAEVPDCSRFRIPRILALSGPYPLPKGGFLNSAGYIPAAHRRPNYTRTQNLSSAPSPKASTQPSS